MKTIVSTAAWLFALVFCVYLAVELVPANYLGGADRVRIVADRIGQVTSEAWDFARPILQLVVVLLIIKSFAGFVNMESDVQRLIFSDTRSLLATVVVVAFAFAALAGTPGQSLLKDVALVIIGFYFGGLNKKGGHNDDVAPSADT